MAAEIRAANLDGLLDFDGVDAVDALLAQIFIDALNAVRAARVPTVTTGLLAGTRAWAARSKHRWAELRTANAAAPVQPTDVLLWPREITHISVLDHAARALRHRGIDFQVLTCQLKPFNEARAAGLTPALTTAAWPRLTRAAAAEGRRRARLLLRPGTWQFSTPDDPLDRLLNRSVQSTLYRSLELVSLAVANARMALDRYRPQVLVVGNDITLEGRAACRVAAQRGIPTVAFMHGNITGNVLHARHCADRFLLHGERHRQDLLARGLRSEQLVVCGAPHLDDRKAQSRLVDQRLQTTFRIEPGRPWILIATSGPGNATSLAHHQQIVNNLARLAIAMPDVPLVVKLHRKDRVEHYQKLLDLGANARVFVIPRGDSRVPYDIFDWLQGCPLVLTGTSTVAVEAMLMDVPVITMDFCDEARGVDFIDEGATLHVRSGEALEAAVRQVLAEGLPAATQARASQYLASAFYRLDGRAAERGAELICGFLQTEGP
jgi:UDP-N-acetylglucosamine 2-epimerase